MDPSPDFDRLAIGTRFASRGRTVTEADVAAFASLTGDMHPQHTDAVWAARSPFGARIAHGMLVLSYAMGLLSLDPERVIALRRVRQAVFKRPVMVGDTIRADAKVDSLEPVTAATGVVGIRVDVVNQRGRVVVRAVIDVVWRRGEGVPAAGQAPAAVQDAVELAGLPL